MTLNNITLVIFLHLPKKSIYSIRLLTFQAKISLTGLSALPRVLVCLSVHHFVSIHFTLPLVLVCLSICPPICLLVCVCVCVRVCVCVCVFAHQLVSISALVSVCLSLCNSICLSVCPSFRVCLPFHLFVSDSSSSHLRIILYCLFIFSPIPLLILTIP